MNETPAITPDTADRDLRRYRRLLREELRTVFLDEGEIMMLLDSCNEVQFGDDFDRHAVLGEILDNWSSAVDLVDKAGKWTLGQEMAIIDAAEFFWSVKQDFRAAGLERCRACNAFEDEVPCVFCAFERLGGESA
jgi:hypothetical protein